ncbi:hypothetical protein [Arsenicibacter rosenii]|uniref:Uncharacterized protein n=1 Tax=Arsenicibacter rosenii TaxID=1750698 RepID=A0A1S2VA59_9BACT|nr:hypothetical protein [Arsenicibacter rosenii]OIN55627.1 hypothetical protein BLX24_29015 [Arsenicibacter rosenii]
MNLVQSAFLNNIAALNLTELEEELTFKQTYQPNNTVDIAALQLAIQVANVSLGDEVTSHFTTRLNSGLEFTGVVDGKYTFSEPVIVLGS